MTHIKVCSVHDVAPGSVKRVEVDAATAGRGGEDIAIAVVRESDGSWHAVGDRCTHGPVSLSEGDLVSTPQGCAIGCWGHGATFNLTTGEPTLPAVEPIAVYPVTISGEDILIEI